VQSAINAVNERRAPLADSNERFSGANWVALILGGLLFLLGLVGTFLPAA
jgi:hypothetical protein